MHYGLSTQIRHISLKWEEVDMAEGVVKKKFLERENKGIWIDVRLHLLHRKKSDS